VSIRADAAEPHLARRSDPGTGTREAIGFRGPEGRRIFTCTYLPERPARASVLICPPIYGEFTKNYRREVLLARRLAAEGFAVERFHYLGTGNSDGEDSEVTFESMRDDALVCAEHLRNVAEADTLVLVGTRWGGLVAASAASGHPGTGLVLWEPLLDASRFFKDAFRARIIFERKSGIEHPKTGAELIASLHEGETVDVVGSTIQKRFFESSGSRTLDGELDASTRAILVIQIGPSQKVRADLAEQAERWRQAGHDVDIETVEGDETWWLVDERWHDEALRPMTQQLIERTAAWIGGPGAPGGRHG
jgi:alpha/beta superfamily hydrolase